MHACSVLHINKKFIPPYTYIEIIFTTNTYFQACGHRNWIHQVLVISDKICTCSSKFCVVLLITDPRCIACIWDEVQHHRLLHIQWRCKTAMYINVSICTNFTEYLHVSLICNIDIHYDDVIMSEIASQITSLTIVYSIVHSGTDQSKHQSSASLAFVWEIHRWPVNFPHKWPVTRKMFPFDDVIMFTKHPTCSKLNQIHVRMFTCKTLKKFCSGAPFTNMV